MRDPASKDGDRVSPCTHVNYTHERERERRETETRFLFVALGVRVSPCYGAGCPETHFVDPVGLELIEICLTLPSESWD